jgi:hypothetical protein
VTLPRGVSECHCSCKYLSDHQRYRWSKDARFAMSSGDPGPSESADRTRAQTSDSSLRRAVTPLPTRPGTSAPNDEWDGHVRSTRRDAVTSPEIEARRKSLPPRHTHRGLTFEEIEENGIISIDEKSSQFNQLPISEAEIKKLPKKVSRPGGL